MATALEILKAQTTETLATRFSPETIPTDYMEFVAKVEALTPEPCDLKISGEPDTWGMDFYGEDEEGERFAVDFLPWAQWRDSEISVPEDTCPMLLAALIYEEMTVFGKDEATRDAKRQELAGMAGEVNDEYREISPGIVVSPQVQAAMDKDGEIYKMMMNLNPQEILSKGKKLS